MFSAPLKVLVVDDHKNIHDVVDRVLRNTPDITVRGHAANGLEAIHACEQFKPDVVLMDVVMPVMNGLQATKVLRERFPEIKILVLSSFNDHESVHALLKHGAAGYITKKSLVSELVNILRATAQGTAVFSPEVVEALVLQRTNAEAIHHFKLTNRELEVLYLMADGLTQQEMALKLSISLSTTKYHYANIFQKLGVKNSSEAIKVAIRNNLI